MAAAPAAARGGPAGPLDGGGSDDDGGGPIAAAAPAAAAAAEPPAGFPFWVDEVLWSQGKVAVELIEEVLEGFGGRRVGGPPKVPKDGAAAAAPAAPAAPAAASLSAAATAAAASLPALAAAAAAADAGNSGGGGGGVGIVAAMAARLGLGGGGGGGVRGGGGSGGGSASEELAGAPKARADEDQLGYRHTPEWAFLWTKSVYGLKAVRAMGAGQVVSAVAGLNSLTMKKRMIATLKTSLGVDLAAQVAPVSFCLPEELPQWKEWLERNPDKDTGLWMLKTGQDAGKGLRLVPTCSALQAGSQAPRHPERAHTHLKVAQVYITNPLLLRGRKFHLRLWVNVTGHAPLRAYMHTRGLVLFSSTEYEPNRPLAAGVRPAASHVTNLARNEDTWVWGLETLAAHFEASGATIAGAPAWPALWREMRRRAALALAAALPSLRAAAAWLRPPAEGYGFQMVGLDFLIDEDLAPWLLEFNSAPSIMAVHSDPAARALIRDNKGAMLRDTVAMVAHRISSGGGAAAAGRRAPRAPPPPRRGAAADWRNQLASEMGARGGYEALMPAFPYEHAGIPWGAEDRSLREVFEQHGWPWEA